MVKIEAIRKAKGMTRRELSEKTGLCQLTILRYETGERCPTITAALAIARALGCELADLIDETPGR